MNLPNKLTLARLVLTAVFVAVISIDLPLRYSLGALTFSLAAITDFLDGHLARKYNLVTAFGKLMDPLADKILMCSAFVILAKHDQIPAWVVIAILSREFLVTGLRLLATANGAVLAADSLGKLKTILQIVLSIYLLLFLASAEPAFAFLEPVYLWVPTSPGTLGIALIAATTVVTLASGFNYLWHNRELIADS